MRLDVGHGLSFDLQAVPHPHVAVDLRQAGLGGGNNTLSSSISGRGTDSDRALKPPAPHLDLKRMDHDLHQHLLVWKKAVQVQALTLHCLRGTRTR